MPVQAPDCDFLPFPAAANPAECDSAAKARLRSYCFTCEWAFPAPLFENPVCAKHGEELAALPTGSARWNAKLEEYTATDFVKTASVQFMAFVDLRAKELEATELSWSIEYCPGSETAGRFHAHAVFSVVKREAGGGQPMNLGRKEPWSFHGSAPCVRVNHAKGRGAIGSIQRAHAYLQIRKTGSMVKWSNYRKGHEFVCQANWTLNWWMLGKLTCEGAKDEILDNMHQCERALRAVSHWEALMQEREEKKEQLAVKASVSRSFSAFRRYPILDAFMERHSASFYGLATRFPFAVIVGESNTGKTQLAQSLYGAESTFYCNVQNAEEPNLKGFSRGKRRAILMDEATPAFVVQNKVVFQANVEGCFLQESRCQQFSTWKLLYSTPIIVCTNSWDLRTVHPDEQWWLASNSMVLHVGSEPTFVE